MATGNTHKKIGEDRTCSSEDMIADRQHTHTQTDMLITILCAPLWGRSNKPFSVLCCSACGGRAAPPVSSHRQ